MYATKEGKIMAEKRFLGLKEQPGILLFSFPA
jgi:hypothetical protein